MMMTLSTLDADSEKGLRDGFDVFRGLPHGAIPQRWWVLVLAATGRNDLRDELIVRLVIGKRIAKPTGKQRRAGTLL